MLSAKLFVSLLLFFNARLLFGCLREFCHFHCCIPSHRESTLEGKNLLSSDKKQTHFWMGPGFDTRSGNIFSFLLPLFQEGQLFVTGESMCTKYWLTA